MAEVVERRKVIIEYENRITNDLGSQDGRPAPMSEDALADMVERALERNLNRRGSLFNGAVTR